MNTAITVKILSHFNFFEKMNFNFSVLQANIYENNCDLHVPM